MHASQAGERRRGPQWTKHMLLSRTRCMMFRQHVRGEMVLKIPAAKAYECITDYTAAADIFRNIASSTVDHLVRNRCPDTANLKLVYLTLCCLAPSWVPMKASRHVRVPPSLHPSILPVVGSKSAHVFCLVGAISEQHAH
jgi:hypothetical protein